MQYVIDNIPHIIIMMHHIKSYTDWKWKLYKK